MTNQVYEYVSLSRDAVTLPTRESFLSWLRDCDFPQDPVGRPGRNPLEWFIESINDGAWVTVTPTEFYVSHNRFFWYEISGMGGCFVEHLLELTSDRFISAREVLEKIEEVDRIIDHEGWLEYT